MSLNPSIVIATAYTYMTYMYTYWLVLVRVAAE